MTQVGDHPFAGNHVGVCMQCGLRERDEQGPTHGHDTSGVGSGPPRYLSLGLPEGR